MADTTTFSPPTRGSAEPYHSQGACESVPPAWAGRGLAGVVTDVAVLRAPRVGGEGSMAAPKRPEHDRGART